MIAAFRISLLLLAPVALAQQASSDTQSPFLSIPPAVADGLRFGAPLPEFEAKDIGGRTWRREDLRGKLTVVYLWNTFEARATDTLDPRARGSFHGLPDLPELQRFYDRVKDSKNIQVLTFCRDYDYTHAHDYMQQKGYTFPVIADWGLANKLFPEYGRQWAVNPDGRLSYPFHYWSLGRLLYEVERAARN